MTSWGDHPALSGHDQDDPFSTGSSVPAPVHPSWQPEAGSSWAERPAWGQHSAPHAPGDAAHAGPAPRPERNPYQVTPAQYYRDQGYGDPLPTAPQPAKAHRKPGSYLPGRNARSSTLGIASLVLVVGMLGVCLAAAQSVGRAYASIYISVGSLDPESARISDAMVAPAVAPTAVIGLASAVGFIGVVLGIVAAATRRGRSWGVAAIIAGILAPVMWFSVVMVALLPVLQALR